MFANYFKEVYLDSDTKVACITGAPSEVPQDWFLTNEMKVAGARQDVNGQAGTRRACSRTRSSRRATTAGWSRSTTRSTELKPDSMKGYTIGDNTQQGPVEAPVAARRREARLSRLREVPQGRARRTSASTRGCSRRRSRSSSRICSRTRTCATWPRPRRTGRSSTSSSITAAYRWAGGGKVEDAWAQFEKTGRIEWVTDLAEIPAKHGVTQRLRRRGPAVRADRRSRIRAVSAVMIGQLGQGPRRTITCAGAPTPSGRARRSGRSRRCAGSRFPRTCRRSTASRRSARADGPVKTAIFGGNNARLYNFKPEQRAELATTSSRTTRPCTRSTARDAPTSRTGTR